MTYSVEAKEFIFEEDRPFASCHASTLVVLPDGDVLAAWFGGSREGAPDVAIWTARRTDGGWSAPVKVADEEGLPHWNPVLYLRPDGKLLLFYKVGPRVAEWHTRIIHSDDNGFSWSEPKELVPGDIGGRGPVKNKPIMLRNGTLLAPNSLEPAWDAFIDISSDHGDTWTQMAIVPLDHGKLKLKGIIQPTLWESEDGSVHLLARSTEGAMYRSDSQDGGFTWCEAYPTDMPNNNSGFDLARLSDGTLAMAYNPTVPREDDPKGKGPRTPLVLRLSRDDGATWGEELPLDSGISQYSYPAVVAHGNNIYISYTWRRERIAFFHIVLKQ